MRSARWLAVTVAAVGCVVVGSALKPTTADARPFWGLTGQFQREDLESMRASGAASVATLLPWHEVQADGPDSFNWGRIDAFVAEAARQDIEVIFILYGSPAFISSQPEIPPVGSAEAEEGWRGFVQAAVERYGPRGDFWKTHTGPPRPVRAWQVWQEPGLKYFFQPKPSVKKYVKLLRATSNAVRAIDPGAKILMGALNDPQDKLHINLKTFLKRFYKIGGKGIGKTYDALSLHPYGPKNKTILRKLTLARDLMRRAGEGKTPIWVTEVGWSSQSGERLMVGRKGQEKRLRNALRMLKKKRREFRIKRVLVYTWQDSMRTSTCWCDTAGLLDFDGEPKPALRAFERFADG